MHFFCFINLALKMLNCFCDHLKEEFGAIRRNSHQAFLSVAYLYSSKYRNVSRKTPKLGVLGMSGPSQVLFFFFQKTQRHLMVQFNNAT